MIVSIAAVLIMETVWINLYVYNKHTIKQPNSLIGASKAMSKSTKIWLLQLTNKTTSKRYNAYSFSQWTDSHIQYIHNTFIHTK